MSDGLDSREPHERLEPCVDDAPVAFARDVIAPGVARLAPMLEQRLQRGDEAVDGLVRRAAAGARDLSRRDRIPRGNEYRRRLLPGLEQHDAEALEVRR